MTSDFGAPEPGPPGAGGADATMGTPPGAADHMPPSRPPAPARPPGGRGLPGPVVVALSFAAGAVPFTGLAARLVAGVDLRRVGTGTVSGTGLYDVAGFGPLAVAGSLDVAKGALAPWLAGRGRPGLQAAATAAAVCGHNWSPWLRGSGGRGVATSLGALAVAAPEGAALLGLGLGLGRLRQATAVSVAAAAAALPAVLGVRRGPAGAALGAAVALPMAAKRLAGNRPLPPGAGMAGRLQRLLFDRDRGCR